MNIAPIANALKGTELTFTQQVMLIAALETCIRNWNSTLEIEIESRYGSHVIEAIKAVSK